MNRYKFMEMEGTHIEILRMYGDTFWAEDKEDLLKGSRYFYGKGYKNIYEVKQDDMFGYSLFNEKEESINCVIDLLKTKSRFRHTDKSLRRIKGE